MNEMIYDIIVIGTGAGGGTALHALADSGLRILVLERGSFLPRERENWDPREVFTRRRYRATEMWRDGEGSTFSPFTHYWVGGNTKVYGGALLRLRESDFEAVDHFGGTSPAWPLAYDIFEPWYTRAEALYSAHGQAGLDPCEPRRSGPYPHPPIPYEPRMAEISAGFAAQGLRPFPCPLAVRLDPTPGRPQWVLSAFDGYPDLTERKADSEVVAVLPALRHANVELRTNSYVDRLETDVTGRQVVSAVVGQPGGPQSRVYGRRFVLAAGAINSAALLLRSGDSKHPAGLANGSGLVGRHLMLHNNGMVVAITHVENPSQFQKAFAISDYYEGGARSSSPLGFIQLMGNVDPDFLATLTEPHLSHVPIDERHRHTVDFFLTSEDLPDPENRVTVDPDGTIRLTYRENNREAYHRLREALVGHFEGIGCDRDRHAHHHAYVGPKLGISSVSHQCGTLRFGADPRTSVLDLDNKAHELDNLWVVDGSFFPSSGAVNPSLTIMANALRVAEQLR